MTLKKVTKYYLSLIELLANRNIIFGTLTDLKEKRFGPIQSLTGNKRLCVFSYGVCKHLVSAVRDLIKHKMTVTVSFTDIRLKLGVRHMAESKAVK